MRKNSSMIYLIKYVKKNLLDLKLLDVVFNLLLQKDDIVLQDFHLKTNLVVS